MESFQSLQYTVVINTLIGLLEESGACRENRCVIAFGYMNVKFPQIISASHTRSRNCYFRQLQGVLKPNIYTATTKYLSCLIILYVFGKISADKTFH